MAKRFAPVKLRTAAWIIVERAAELSGRSVQAVREAIARHSIDTNVVLIPGGSHSLVDRSVLQVLSGDLMPAA